MAHLLHEQGQGGLEFGDVSHMGIITDGGYGKGYGFVTFHCQQTVKNLLEGPNVIFVSEHSLYTKLKWLELKSLIYRNIN